MKFYDGVKWDGSNRAYAEIQQFTRRRCELFYGQLTVWGGPSEGYVTVPLGHVVIEDRNGAYRGVRP